MYVCPNCNNQSATPMNFCNQCGSQMVEQPEQPAYQQPAYEQPAYQQPAYQQPVYEQPAYQQPTYQQPVYAAPAAPVAAETPKVKQIISMVLGLNALVYGILGLVICWVPIYGMTFGIIAIPCGIVGKILAGVNFGKMGRIGKKTGNIGFILGIIAAVIGLIMTIVMMAVAGGSSYYS